MVTVLRGHPTQYARCLRPRLSRPPRGASPGWQIRERHRPWPRGRARLGSHDVVRLRSELRSHASLHLGRSTFAITVSSNSYVTSIWTQPPRFRLVHLERARRTRVMSALLTALTSRVRVSSKSAGLYVIAQELAVAVVLACTQWNEQVILARSFIK